MSSIVLIATKVLALLVLVAATFLIRRRRDAWGRVFLLSFLALAHGRRLIGEAVRPRTAGRLAR